MPETSGNQAMSMFARRTLLASPPLLLARDAAAQDYPARPITLIVQFGPGSTTDIVARRLAELLAARLGQPMVAVNRAGGGGVIGIAEMARAVPDGYTIGLVNMPALTTIPHLQPVPYDPLSAFHHIGVIGPYEYGIYVAATAPWRSWEELVAHARANPGRLSYGTPGAGTTNHLVMERIGRDLGLEWTHVPFRGDGELIPNILGGHVQLANGSPGAVAPQVAGGALRLLLVTSRDRWHALPDVPTMQEKGFSYFQSSFLSMAAPAGIPDAVKARLDSTARSVLTDPAVVQEFRDRLSVTVVFEPGDQYARFLRDQSEFWRGFLPTLKMN
jgi:tripartite-type tricarboxylate transporter receptor subunit TctC